jgi:hypothetical protein
MVAFLALSGATILAALAALHLYWAFGSRGVFPAVVPTRPDGEPLFVPGPFASLAVALMLFAAAFLLVERGGWGPGVLPRPWRIAGTACVAAALLLRGIGDFRYVGLFKRHRVSRFAVMDTRLYTPLVLALSLLAGTVAALGE